MEAFSMASVHYYHNPLKIQTTHQVLIWSKIKNGQQRRSQMSVDKNNLSIDSFKQKQGVMSHYALTIYIKKYLKAKEE
jgi:hypothetical protein